jgi:catechol 2,3-dioxygenase-like lactoylglutathione lyase family enzyme
MLNSASVYATLPVVDLKRARKFYEEKLGLKVIKEDPSPGVTLQAGNGTHLYLYQRGATKADHTVADFVVANVEAEVKQLKAKGVKFEEYNIPSMGIKTVNGVATMEGYKAAWFKDTEGNILGISNQ